MANKLFLVCATLALCVLLTNASIYRTVVELDEDDSTNQIRPQKCRREFQQEQHLRACQRWIRKQIRRPFGVDADVDDIEEEFDTENQRAPILQRCCFELRQEDPECVCPTLKQAAKAVRFQGQHGPFETSHIYRAARRLPNVCNIPQVGTCPFMGIPFFPPY